LPTSFGKEATKIIPIYISSTDDDICKITPNNCILTLKNIDGEGKDTIIIVECGSDIPIDISLIDTCCIKFSH
jgi:hypothetical protein